MSGANRTDVARLLDELEGGDQAALDELFPLVYDELRTLAHYHRRRWRGDETLETTALVHEAYLKLVGQSRIRAESRAHFLAVAARAMRHILSNYARDQRTEKRGGAARKLSFDELKLTPAQVGFSPEQADELVALNEALGALEQVSPRRSQVVECRFYGGMTIEDTAAALGISPRTVKRDWAVAQAWLLRRMEEGG
jgi:RNA polymerase sigma factor (TIGR02999 family)